MAVGTQHRQGRKMRQHCTSTWTSCFVTCLHDLAEIVRRGMRHGQKDFADLVEFYRGDTIYVPPAGAESYRMLRTLLQSSPPVVQTLLITSVTPGEGKTATAMNLAVSFAQLGKTVLLVDADLRRPSLHRTFDMASTVGLTDILLHGIDWRVGLQETPMENLKVILAGVKRPNNPSELLSSRRMGTLLKSWKECFDLIIFDSPILPGVSDVAVMAPAMDGVLLVHYPAKGDKAAVLEARKLLERVGARCVGMVFNW